MEKRRAKHSAQTPAAKQQAASHLPLFSAIAETRRSRPVSIRWLIPRHLSGCCAGVWPSPDPDPDPIGSARRLRRQQLAQPVKVQAAELSQAMATGVVGSYRSSGSTGHDSKTFEPPNKCRMDTHAWLPKIAVLVKKAAFDALDKTQPGCCTPM